MTLAHDIKEKDRTKDVQISKDVTFETMLLASNTLQGLKKSGFYRPSPIQLLGIPLGKCGFDLLLEAKSGTGKTAVFSVIALEKIDLSNGLQVIILTPTREIAMQIYDVIRQIGSSYDGLSVEVVMGGLPVQDDIKKFCEGSPHIVVGSPGRLKHLIHDKYINVSAVRLLVLDEADKLMEKSFLVDIKYIHSAVPKQKQVIMSSATYPESSKDFISQFVSNAQHVCPNSNSVLLGVIQKFTNVKYNSNIMKQTQFRFKELKEILSKIPFKQCLIFCNYQARVAELHKMLLKEKWPAEQLHGQQDQTDRLDALKTLQDYKCRILISTDLASRGIDASNIDLVINFEPPFDWQTYLHRIGRAGRFGSYGTAITILSEGTEHKKYMNMITSLNAPITLIKLWEEDPSSSEKDFDATSQQSSTKENIETTSNKEITKLIRFDNKNDEVHKESFEYLLNSYHNYKDTDLIEDDNVEIKECSNSKLIKSLKPLIKESKCSELWQLLNPDEENVCVKPFHDLLESCKSFACSVSSEDDEFKCLHMPQLKILCKPTLQYLINNLDNFIGIDPSIIVHNNNSSPPSYSNMLLDSSNTANGGDLNENKENCYFKECQKSATEVLFNKKSKSLNTAHDKLKIDESESMYILENKHEDATKEVNNYNNSKPYYSDVNKCKSETLDTRLNIDNECNKLWNTDNIDFIKLGLPTAFGSSKNKRKDYRSDRIKPQYEKNDHEPIKLWVHKPSQHIADSGISTFEENSRKNIYRLNRKKISHDSDYSSNSHDLQASDSSKYNTFTKRNSHNTRKHADSSQNALAYNQTDNYNNWYKQLKLRVKQIEMVVYMNELTKLNN